MTEEVKKQYEQEAQEFFNEIASELSDYLNKNYNPDLSAEEIKPYILEYLNKKESESRN